MTKFLVLSIAMFLSGGCSYNSFLDNSDDSSFSNLPNFRQINSGIYIGGRPSMEGIRLLREKEVKTILSLRPDDNLTFAEKHLAKQYGLEFLNITVSVYKKPTEEQISEFLKMVTDGNKHPLYIHCDEGKEQTTMMIAAYRVFVEGWSPEKAFEEIREVGFPSHLPHGELKKFIYGMKSN